MVSYQECDRRCLRADYWIPVCGSDRLFVGGLAFSTRRTDAEYPALEAGHASLPYRSGRNGVPLGNRTIPRG